MIIDPTGWTARFGKSFQLQESWKQLIDGGCQPQPLIALLGPCIYGKWESELRKKDLNEIKTCCERLVRRLEDIAHDSENLGKLRLKHMNGEALSTVLSLPVSLGLGIGLVPPAGLFAELSAELREQALRLKGLERAIAEAWSMRHRSAAWYVLLLYLYCRKATRGKATYKNLAEIMNAGWEASGVDERVTEDRVRMQVCRLKRPQTAGLLQATEALMTRYVASCPTGDPTFTEWALTRNLPTQEDDLYKLLARESDRRSSLLEPASTPPDSPAAITAEIEAFLAALRNI